MFDRMRRKLRKKRGPTDIFAVPQSLRQLLINNDSATSTISGRSRSCSRVPNTPPILTLAAVRGSEIDNVVMSENVSHLDLDDDYSLGMNVARYPSPVSMAENIEREEGSYETRESRETSWELQESPSAERPVDHLDVETMKYITVLGGTESRGALLLPTVMYSRMNCLASKREELRHVDSSMATTTKRLTALLAERSILARLEGLKVPGAFPCEDEEQPVEHAQQSLASPRRQLDLCRKSLESLDAQKTRLLAALEPLQESILSDIERVARENFVTPAYGADIARRRRKPDVWWEQ